MTLNKLLARACAFDEQGTEAEGKEWSWEQYGSEGLALVDFRYGAKNQHARLTPIMQALVNVALACETNDLRGYKGRCAVDNALAELREVLK